MSSTTADKATANQEAVRFSIEAALLLDKEAGNNDDSLSCVLQTIATENGRAHFNCFCADITASIRTCFSRSKAVTIYSARERAYRQFHKLRIEILPGIWKTFASSLGVACVKPLQLQAVNRELFNRLMVEFCISLHPAVVTTPKCVTLLADEENAVRYASGYVAMKLTKKFEKSEGVKATEFRECLSHMVNKGDESSFYKYTLEWTNSINRGGLFVISDAAFMFFKAVEVKTQELLPEHLSSSHGNKDTLMKAITDDENIQFYWSMLAIDIHKEDDAMELLQLMVGMWVTMRGFAITSMWMEDYKRATAKNVKKGKSLRKGLQSSEEDS